MDLKLVSDPIDIVSCLLVFLVGLLFSIKFAKSIKTNQSRLLKIYIWHTFFSILYATYVILFGGDAGDYYTISKDRNFELISGTAGIISISSIFANHLNLSFLGTTLVFQTFGFVGLSILDKVLQDATREKSILVKKLASTIIFLPSISFWSSGIGKDAISFLSITLALWACLQIKYRFKYFAIATSLMFFVRPHIGGIMLLSFSIFSVLSKGYNIKVRLASIFFMIIPSIAAVPFALNYAGAGDISNTTQASEYISQRQGYNHVGGAGDVDISNMSLPLQLFTYVFRPLPYEARSVGSFLAAIDNTILLFLFLIYLKNRITRRTKYNIPCKSFFVTYTTLTLLILATTTANLGISVRQKWMFLPIIIYVMLQSMPKKSNRTIAVIDPASNFNKNKTI